MANGFPAPTYTETGPLPTGVTLSSSGLLSGTPLSPGSYLIVITATNSVGSLQENFTLTVSGGSNSQTITTPGSGNWVDPAGITSITVECWGAGGGGGSASGLGGAEGGGGGGAYAKKNTYAVTPGTSYPYTVGAGAAATAGGATSFNTNVCIGAGGGAGGSSAGAGGTTAASTGDVKWAGGSGVAGASFGYGGGGGGGSAGTGSAGNTGSTYNGATAVTGGGPGGTGTPSGTGNGSAPASGPGGGGGGAACLLSSCTGGAGFAGQLKISWTVATPAKVVFVQQPSNAGPGATITPAVTVQVQDASNNNIGVAGIDVTVALTGTGTLSGTLTQTTNSSGLATFSDLSINQGGAKNLTASSLDLTSAVSNAFTISATGRRGQTIVGWNRLPDWMEHMRTFTLPAGE